MNTSNIFYVTDSDSFNNLEKVYFTFNDCSFKQDVVQLCVYIYPKYTINQGYASIKTIVENFIQNTSLYDSKITVDIQMPYIKIKSAFIDISKDHSICDLISEDFDIFKTSIIGYLNFVKSLLSFVSPNTDFNIKINLSKISHLNLGDCVNGSEKSLNNFPEALKRVLEKSDTAPVTDQDSKKYKNLISKSICRSKLIKAKDIVLEKDNVIPKSLTRVLNNE